MSSLAHEVQYQLQGWYPDCSPAQYPIQLPVKIGDGSEYALDLVAYFLLSLSMQVQMITPSIIKPFGELDMHRATLS